MFFSRSQDVGLTPADEGLGFDVSIWARLLAAIQNTDSNSFKAWQVAEKSLSLWEQILLEWAMSAGELQNHEACGAHHADGNSSHFLETMWLGGKVDSTDKTKCTRKVQSMQNGKMLLPLQGVVFDMRCGSDFLHLSLCKTIHVADETRERCNWSRVHGPQFLPFSSARMSAAFLFSIRWI